LLVVEAGRVWVIGGIAVGLLALGLVAPRSIGGAAAQLGYLGVAYVAFAARVIDSRYLVAIGRRTMGIYLLHMPIVMKLSTSVADRLIGSAGLAAFALVTVLSFTMALALTAALEGARLSGIVLGDRRPAARPAPAAAR
jgi:fucose 4-O-acetylase-like acetyltransferase